MDWFFKIVTWVGSAWVLFPLAVVISGILWLRGRGSDAVLVSGGLLGASVLAHGLKLFLARPRPDVPELLVAMPSDFSFPSAHTAQAVAFALVCAVAAGRGVATTTGMLVWGALIMAAVLVGISRVYLQVHYVSDVVAGAMLGVAWVLALNWLLKWSAARV
jgi:undecaprenyl-diphosphatase